LVTRSTRVIAAARTSKAVMRSHQTSNADSSSSMRSKTSNAGSRSSMRSKTSNRAEGNSKTLARRRPCNANNLSGLSNRNARNHSSACSRANSAMTGNSTGQLTSSRSTSRGRSVAAIEEIAFPT